jgi:hypothetical protein
MARFGWALIASGLVILAAVAARLVWVSIYAPEKDDSVESFLMTAGLWCGLIMPVLGAIRVTNAREGSVPPA